MKLPLSALNKAFVLAIVLLSFFIMPTAADTMLEELDTDYVGNNYYGKEVATKEECRDACLAETKCLVATYRLDAFGSPPIMCWMKDKPATDPSYDRKFPAAGSAPLILISYVRQVSPPGGGCWGAAPHADFSATPLTGEAPLLVQFTDLSAGGVGGTWNFGDNTGQPYNAPIPVFPHTYGQPGTYTVSLTLQGECPQYPGGPPQVDTKTRTGYITVNPGTGAIAFSSVPAGAGIWIDGTQIQAVTPFTQQKVSPGSHQIRISLAGYNDYIASVNVIAKQTVPVTATLTQSQSPPGGTGSIIFSSTPSGAGVSVNSVPKGTTPVTVSGVAAGSHTVLFTLAGYNDYSGTVTVTAGQATPVSVQLVPKGTSDGGSATGTGTASISTFPPGASINLDGWDKGKTPQTFSGLKAGAHSMTLKLAGYNDYAGTVMVEAGRTTPVSVSLVPAGQGGSTTGTGALSVQSDPVGATVYLDGERLGETPLAFQNIRTGTHRLLLTMQGYKDRDQVVEVSAGSTKEVFVAMGGSSKTPGFAALLAVLSLAAGLLLWRRKP